MSLFKKDSCKHKWTQWSDPRQIPEDEIVSGNFKEYLLQTKHWYQIRICKKCNKWISRRVYK